MQADRAKLRIERAASGAAAACAALHAASFPRPWDERAFAAFFQLPGVAGLVALEGGLPVGMALLRATAGEAELLTIAAMPEARRRGIGGALLARAIDAARERGAAALHLEVAETNKAARRLYARAGFVETGRRAGYYREPSGAVDAITLTLALGEARG